jgi:hypothetical protein
MGWRDRLIEWVGRNPIAWLLLVLLAICEWGNYHTGHDLRELCELLGEHVASVAHPVTVRDQIDNICLRHADEP